MSREDWRKGLNQPDKIPEAKQTQWEIIQSIHKQPSLRGLELLVGLLATAEQHYGHRLPTWCSRRPPNTLCYAVDSSLYNFRWVNHKAWKAHGMRPKKSPGITRREMPSVLICLVPLILPIERTRARAQRPRVRLWLFLFKDYSTLLRRCALHTAEKTHIWG